MKWPNVNEKYLINEEINNGANKKVDEKTHLKRPG